MVGLFGALLRHPIGHFYIFISRLAASSIQRAPNSRVCSNLFLRTEPPSYGPHGVCNLFISATSLTAPFLGKTQLAIGSGMCGQ